MSQIIRSPSDLPNLSGSDLFFDLETTSGNPKLDSLNPWHNCKICGIAVTTNLCGPQDAWYIPLRHKYSNEIWPNLPIEPVREWLIDLLGRIRVWSNHNVKYDAHVLLNDFGINYQDFGISLYDTLSMAKLLNSDLFDYGLDALSKRWLNKDISEYELAFRHFLFNSRNQRINSDYGEIPIDKLGPYACQDVITTRELKAFIESKLPESCKLVKENELKITSILFDVENNGLRIDPVQAQIKQIEVVTRLSQIPIQIYETTGEAFKPNSNDDCYEFLCCRNGLPILKWTNEDDPTKKSNPSFDKHALKDYAVHPKVLGDELLKKSIELIQEYRKLETFNSLFLNTYLTEHLAGLLHSSYNQMVRTGRMSCSSPNAQQLSELAKELIIALGDDWLIVDIDLSQIEFRLIGSVLGNSAIIHEYNINPDADYHQIIADKAGTQRKPAKTINFGVGFGAGKAKTIAMLKSSLDVVSSGFDPATMDYASYCELRANKLYADYHAMLPELKPTTKQAERITKSHGYIDNMYGRRRRLGPEHCYRAFNTYIQSSAADIMKSITVRIHESGILNELVKLIAIVHDSWVFYMHKSVVQQACSEIVHIIETEMPPKPLKIPIRCSVKSSNENWRKCA